MLVCGQKSLHCQWRTPHKLRGLSGFPTRDESDREGQLGRQDTGKASNKGLNDTLTHYRNQRYRS